MAEFDSPLGRKSTSSSPSRRVFTVEDESSDQFDIPEGARVHVPEMRPGVPVELTPEQFNALQSRRKEVTANSKKVSNDAKLRLEMLTGIGRMTKDFTLNGVTFTLRTLKTKELREVVLLVSTAEAVDFNFEVRAQQLARSLCKIDGHPVDLVLGDDSLEARLEFLNELDEAVVSHMHSKYSEMSKESQARFGVINEEGVKEVVEDTKK